MRIAQNALIAIIGLSFVISTWSIPRDGLAGEKAVATPAKTDAVSAFFTFPKSEERAFRYSATLKAIYSANTKVAMSFDFLLWKPEAKKLSVKVLKASADLTRDGGKVPFAPKKVRDLTLEIGLNASGKRRFVLPKREKEGLEREAVADSFRRHILPMLLPDLPVNFIPRAGFRWGKAHGPDKPDSFSSRARCTEWSVRRLVKLADKPVTAVIGSRKENTLKRSARLPVKPCRLAWRDITIEYDITFKRVRNAHEQYQYSGPSCKDGTPLAYRRMEVLVNMLPRRPTHKDDGGEKPAASPQGGLGSDGGNDNDSDRERG